MEGGKKMISSRAWNRPSQQSSGAKGIIKGPRVFQPLLEFSLNVHEDDLNSAS